MSWMQKLYDVYAAAEQEGLVGAEVSGQDTLLPFCHMTVQVPLEITITPDGDFVRATVIENKAARITVIPCNEESASRTSGVAALPLNDKLLYMAGDCGRYLPPMEKGKQYDTYFEAYLAGLKDWCASGLAHPAVQSWLRYVEKRRLIADLIAYGTLPTDENGRVPLKCEGKDKPPLYKAITSDLTAAFVRIRVTGEDEERLWMNAAVRQSFIDYQQSLVKERDVCYALGRELPVSASSPKYIRYPGDGAKLISANEKSFIVYSGRFASASEAMTVSREATEKSHAALKWLIQRQGWRNGDQVVLAFADGGRAMPSPAEDLVSMERDLLLELGIEHDETFTTGDAFAKRLNQALSGLRCRIAPTDGAVVIGLDSATPGRLSIFYYRELRAEDLFARVCAWHSSCAWRHTYRTVQDGFDEKGKPIFRRIVFTGAPAPIDIIKAAYGENVGDKLLKSGVERLLPCVVDSAPVPIDLMKCAARRAAQRISLAPWEADKVLTIACALIRKYRNDQQQREVWTMALQPEVNDRSYLFGRALAYAEHIERFALSQMGEKRPTNAERLMVAFTKHPAKSWMLLMERLQPYQQRLGTRVNRLNRDMQEIISRLETAGFTNEPLSELYCLGYAGQKQQFALERDENIKNNKAKNDSDIENEEE